MWLIIWFVIVTVVAIPVGWRLFGCREYRMENGRLFVRHGRWGQWVDVQKHLEEDHKGDL